MATMSDEAKAKLREAAALRRRENPVPRDYQPLEWLIAADHAKDAGWGGSEDEAVLEGHYLDRDGGRFHDNVAHLRFCPAEAGDALALALPRRRILVRAHPATPWHETGRPVWMFREKTLLAVLEFLRLAHQRNRRGWPKYYSVTGGGDWLVRWVQPGKLVSNPPREVR